MSPSREQLASHAVRQLAGGALVFLAAALVHATGHGDQKWQYIAIAAALAPQAILDLLALADRSRRAALRAASHPKPILLGAGALVGAAGAATWLSGGPGAPALVGLTAATGLVVAAAPVNISVAPRPA